MESFDRVIKAYSQIGEYLTRFQLLNSAFTENVHFQHSLGMFYADILQFHKQAYKLFRKPCMLELNLFKYGLLIMLGWKILFVTSWGRFQRRFDNILDDLKHHGDLIDKEANALDIAEARDTRQKLEAWGEDSLAKLNQYYKEQNVNQLRAILTWLRLNDSEQLVVFEKVATEGSKHPGTVSNILYFPCIF